jgi:hypothetical protein
MLQLNWSEQLLLAWVTLLWAEAVIAGVMAAFM